MTNMIHIYLDDTEKFLRLAGLLQIQHFDSLSWPVRFGPEWAVQFIQCVRGKLIDSEIVRLLKLGAEDEEFKSVLNFYLLTTL